MKLNSMQRIPMDLNYFLREYKKWTLMLLAMSLPVIVIAFFPAYFHPDDMQEFLRWSKVWDLNWSRIYYECNSCNYPFLGTFFSGGVISLLKFEATRHIVRAFHAYLALIDALNIILIYFILKEFDTKNPAFWAGVIGLLPSSWIGTSYWGQIDGIGQFFILATVLSVIIFNRKVNLKPEKYKLFLIFSGFLLSCLLLTKQLAMFSLLSLSAMILTNILLRSRGFKNVLYSSLIFLLSIMAPILLVDTILQIPAPYISHVQYVLATGSQHGDIISSYGFNMWIFFYEDTLLSSHLPLISGFNKFLNIEVSPFSIGILAFLVANLIFLFPICRHFYKAYKSEVYFFRKTDILIWIFQLSFLNLSFNVFLTGTHERYLYHFYPFILIAFLSIPNVSRKVIYVLLFGAVFYGSFLYGYLSALNMLFDRFPFYAMAIFHTCLLVYSGIALNKYFLVHDHD